MFEIEMMLNQRVKRRPFQKPFLDVEDKVDAKPACQKGVLF